MNSLSRTVFIISADSLVAQNCIAELAALGGCYRTPVASSIEQARKGFGRTPPAVLFLEESAIDPLRDGESLETAVGLLAETAPVVVVAAAEKQDDLAFLITSGAVDLWRAPTTSCPSLQVCSTAAYEWPSGWLE